MMCCFFFSSRRRHTRCALVTGVQTCSLPISPQWVVTAAHAAPMQGMEADVTIGGVARRVECVITHPRYARLPEALVEEALASGNASGIHAFLASSDDIALIKLASPVEGVAPMPLYRGRGEVARIVRLVGKGATGNGVDGQIQHGSHQIGRANV